MSIYWGKSFFQFFVVFFSRIVPLIQGKVALQPDEIQLISLSLVSAVCGLLGVFLVVRKMAMVANAITHTVLVGIMVVVIASFYITGAKINLMEGGINPLTLLGASLVTSFLTMFLIDFFSNKLMAQRDVSIGLVFSFLFALGIILATIFTRSTHIGTDVITGNIDMITKADLKLILLLTLFVSTLMGIFWRPLLFSSFDGQFSSISGIPEKVVNYLIVLITSITVIVAMQVVGVVLALALLVVPVIISRLFFNSLKMIVLSSGCLGVITSCIAVALSRHFLSQYQTPLSTGGLLTTLLFLIWICSAIFIRLRRRFRSALTFQKKTDNLQAETEQG